MSEGTFSHVAESVHYLEPCIIEYDAQYVKTALIIYVSSEGPDEPAYPCSLICAFSVCRHILQYPLIMLADNEGPDQPALMRRLIRACVVIKLHKSPFRAFSIILFL